MDDLFFKIFSSLPRQGPGDIKSTRRALDAIAPLPQKPLILDIGCGTGIQTIVLAQITGGYIIALDRYKIFLDILIRKAAQAGIAERISCINADMSSMSFKKGCFDIIWSEGAIYITGFERGLKDWREYLRPKGYIAITEINWLRNDPPEEIRKFFENEYPAIDYIKANISIINDGRYDLIDYFILKENAWWDDYYNPLEATIKSLRNKYINNQDAQRLFDSLQLEIDLYRKYSDYYGYVFYIVRRRH